MAKRPYVDKQTCIGCQLCTTIDPSFVMEDGKAVVKGDNYNPKTVQEAIESCPVNAISWQEDV